MADFVATLWREFGAETQEHLEAVEPILLAAESGTPASAGEVALLFRAFHSLKGLARSMDLYGMERLAHAAESLLSLVRDGLAPLDAGLVAALLPVLAVLDCTRDAAATSDNACGPTARAASSPWNCAARYSR